MPGGDDAAAPAPLPAPLWPWTGVRRRSAPSKSDDMRRCSPSRDWRQRRFGGRSSRLNPDLLVLHRIRDRLNRVNIRSRSKFVYESTEIFFALIVLIVEKVSLRRKLTLNFLLP